MIVFEVDAVVLCKFMLLRLKCYASFSSCNYCDMMVL